MLWSILSFLGVFVAVFVAIRFAAFVVVNIASGHLPGIIRDLGGLAWPLVRAYGTGVMADLIAFASFPLVFVRTLAHRGDGTPVVLVHGLFHNASAWAVMLRRLGRAGFTNLHTYQYDSFIKDFDAATDGLEAKLDALLGDDPQARVLLVGHSLGGMVVRRVAGQDRFRNRVAGILTLGTPHHGSDLARLGMNRMSRGLIPGKYIPEVVNETSEPACPRLAIYTLTDDYVMPLPMLQPAHSGWEERVCSPMGHVWMLFSCEITLAVVDFLRKADPAAKQ